MPAMILAAFLLEGGLMAEWNKVFDDPGTGDWRQAWVLDGLKGSVRNTPAGMILKSGPTYMEDASHLVLWTKASFTGDVRVEYDFTRLDTNLVDPAVCILYLQATGLGTPPYAENVIEWKDLRQVPAMSTYFKYMNCYHISYSTTGGRDFNYVRARRYPQRGGTFDADTRVQPSFDQVDLFHAGETWRLQFQKEGRHLSFAATLGKDRHEWVWDATNHPPILKGNIGLRQMWTRESRIANFAVYEKR
jgi:hypothetical protein